MKRLLKKKINTKTSVGRVSKSVLKTSKKIPRTPVKKRVKKTSKDTRSMSANVDSKNTQRKLKSSIKGMKNPQKYLDFIDWMSRPPKSGEAINQEQFAQEIGVDENTLSRWKEKVGFWEDVCDLRREWAKGKTTIILNSVLRTLLKDAKAPEVKLWLQYTGEFTEKADVNLGVSPELQKILDKVDEMLP